MTWRTPVSVLAAAHLLVAAAGAAGLLGRLDGGGGRAARWYGAMTGADAGYGYFAPHVGSEIRLRFTLADGTGREWEDELADGLGHEGRLRVGSMAGLFPPDPAERALRHDLAASWAAAMFARHPSARTATVRVEAFEVPVLSEYRAGRRPHWVHLFSATFTDAEAEEPKS